MKKFLIVFILFFVTIKISAETKIYLSGIPFKINPDLKQSIFNSEDRVISLTNEKGKTYSSFTYNKNKREITIGKSGKYKIYCNDRLIEIVRIIPAWFSILPPLLAILLALIFRQVLLSLLSGIFLGMFFLNDYNPILAFFKIGDTLIVNILSDKDHIMIILFTLIIGGLVGIISENGGTQALAKAIVKKANTPRKGMFASWLLGVLIFFDDYSNSLLVGNMMKPITDKLKISREKLAYIVDSTAAPVTSLVIVSTWIGYELGLISDGLKSIGSSLSAYDIFIRSIAYRFYPIAALLFVLFVILTERDFGPMYKAEILARKSNGDATDDKKTESKTNTSYKWINAVLPILILLIGTFIGLIITGINELKKSGVTQYGLSEIIGASNSYYALIWGSMLATAIAIIISMREKISLAKLLDAFVQGMKSLFLAVVILTLAWGIGEITYDIHTADYLISILIGNIDIKFLASLVFIVCALTSFSTGTSWGTMAIVMPIVIPLTVKLGSANLLNEASINFYIVSTVAAVLAGSVFGDHCSPIADTTILSSLASGCNHVAHVRTQLPYALLVGAVSFLFGSLLTAFGLPLIFAYLLIFISLIAFLFIFGKRTD